MKGLWVPHLLAFFCALVMFGVAGVATGSWPLAGLIALHGLAIAEIVIVYGTYRDLIAAVKRR